MAVARGDAEPVAVPAAPAVTLLPEGGGLLVVLSGLLAVLSGQLVQAGDNQVVFQKPVAGAGGFQMLWLYGQEWFLNLDVFGTNLRELFQMAPVNLSVAVWVGLIALLGVDAETGVFMLLYLDLAYEKAKKEGRLRTLPELRAAIMEGAVHRLRPKFMTVMTTFLALLPIMWSMGAGADTMKRIAREAGENPELLREAPTTTPVRPPTPPGLSRPSPISSPRRRAGFRRSKRSRSATR